MKATEHPSKWLDKSLVDQIRASALEAESLQQLHPAQLQIIRQQRWLKMLIPKKFWGLELTIPEVLKMEEALAWADGSTAWVVTLCAGAAWFIGFLDPSLTIEVFSDESVFFAGSGAATGTAEIIPEGYLLNGNWKYASGSLHATVFTANCLIKENGQQVFNPDGSLTTRPFLMKREEVTLHKTWNSVGMIATGSNSFEVTNLIVPKKRSFEITAAKAAMDNPIYRYPFLQLAETTLAVNLSGLAVRFIELCSESILHRKVPVKEIARAKSELAKSRTEFYTAASLSWKSCEEKKEVPKKQLQKVSAASQALAKRSVQLVDRLYPHCGLSAANTNLEINRVWRNIHTASQHSLFKWQSRG